MSNVNRATRPQREATDRLIDALAGQIESPQDPATAAELAAASEHWTTVTGERLDADMLGQLRDDAQQLLQRRRRGPPAIESIVLGAAERSDVGYDLGLHLEGLRGTWHRLWALISLSSTMGGDTDDAVQVIRGQLEQQLGRPLTESEWAQLTEHALRHAAQGKL
ncbi:hypothetical protein [Ramlibacter sp. AN1133]|uniref:hypothetical protein n=1 Tax=Ramlibacter sp. AN1133 TaxID=3133429 RepID=UPI0030C10E70